MDCPSGFGLFRALFRAVFRTLFKLPLFNCDSNAINAGEWVDLLDNAKDSSSCGVLLVWLV